jgi:hypothetical protein
MRLNHSAVIATVGIDSVGGVSVHARDFIIDGTRPILARASRDPRVCIHPVVCVTTVCYTESVSIDNDPRIVRIGVLSVLNEMTKSCDLFATKDVMVVLTAQNPPGSIKLRL